jgi:hypothetical protein
MSRFESKHPDRRVALARLLPLTIEIKESRDGGKTYDVDVDTSSEESQYYGMLKTWKDTLFVQGPRQSPDGTTVSGVQVKVRTQYRRYSEEHKSGGGSA